MLSAAAFAAAEDVLGCIAAWVHWQQLQQLLQMHCGDVNREADGGKQRKRLELRLKQFYCCCSAVIADVRIYP